ncbi:MAG: hypothetical protein ACI4ET_02235 [Bilifractor sp.]
MRDNMGKGTGIAAGKGTDETGKETGKAAGKGTDVTGKGTGKAAGKGTDETGKGTVKETGEGPRKEKKKDAMTGAQKLRRMSLNFLPVGIALLIIGLIAGVRAGRLIYVLAFTAPALSFIVMGIFFRKFPVGEDLPPKQSRSNGLPDAGNAEQTIGQEQTTAQVHAGDAEYMIRTETSQTVNVQQAADVQKNVNAQQVTDMRQKTGTQQSEKKYREENQH